MISEYLEETLGGVEGCTLGEIEGETDACFLGKEDECDDEKLKGCILVLLPGL